MLEKVILVWNALLMPTVRSTKPNLDEQLAVALAARIIGIDRAALAHLVDHGLVPRLDLEAVRALAASGEVAARTTDDPGHLVIRMDIDPTIERIGDMSDDDLAHAAEGPHRLPESAAGRRVLLCVRSFIVATGRLVAVGAPIAVRTDRRGREISGRTITVHIEQRLSDLTTRPSKAVGDARWLGRRARVGTGGAVLPLQS